MMKLTDKIKAVEEHVSEELENFVESSIEHTVKGTKAAAKKVDAFKKKLVRKIADVTDFDKIFG